MNDSELIGPNAHLVPKRRSVNLVVRFDEGSALHKLLSKYQGLEVALCNDGKRVDLDAVVFHAVTDSRDEIYLECQASTGGNLFQGDL